ncbi:PorT family protein [Niabella sp. CC-SYL272]|uniref:outer membrane beta-barrel protein n=1 Tax=Niabella agricola TaxID=2891571 RepID=UPI001F3CEC85|nr:outer membrane beta-barrel protein [Niabella agricola]MCF3108898.1 PorT family protein [Niabella agricola]
MKTIKQSLCFLVCSVCCLYGLSARGQVTVSMRAGFNASKVVWKETRNGAAIKNKFNPGYQLGLLTHIPLSLNQHAITLQTGLQFSTKGYRQDYGDETRYGVLCVTPWYIELPLNLIYYLPGDIERFFIGAGGYFAWGVGGRWTQQYKSAWGWNTGAIEYTDLSNQDPDDDKFNYGRRADLGVNLLAGVNISPSIYMQLNGQVGLRNIAPLENKKLTSEEFRNMGLSFAVGYNFQ